MKNETFTLFESKICVAVAYWSNPSWNGVSVGNGCFVGDNEMTGQTKSGHRFQVSASGIKSDEQIRSRVGTL